MKRHWFEIVGCRGDRYSWVLVRAADGRRLVLARGGRDYSSRGLAYRAICALQEVVGDAEILDATGDVELPETSFEIGPYATPLLVGSGTFTDRRRHEWFEEDVEEDVEVNVDLEVDEVDVEIEAPNAADKATAAVDTTPRARATKKTSTRALATKKTTPRARATKATKATKGRKR